jgi:hypothetical protein
VEEALYDSRAMRRFVGINLGQEPAPDETTIDRERTPGRFIVCTVAAYLFRQLAQLIQAI